MMTTTVEPRAWVGCLACYNAGNLNGEWLDGPDALEWKCRNPHHEEFWCFDMEGVPHPREMSPMEFAAMVEFIESIPDYHRAAVQAYLDNQGIAWQNFDQDDFDDHYHGEWDTEKDYAYALAEDTGFEEPTGWPYSCIDWDHATRELFYDHYSIPNPDGGIFVFSN